MKLTRTGLIAASAMALGITSAATAAPPTSEQAPASTPCPYGMMSGGTGGQGMMTGGQAVMGQGGQGMMNGRMMNWQQMESEMQALRQDINQLRTDLEKRGRR